MVVKTFRGLLADGGQDRIRLSTNKGKVGYRIVKLQVIGDEPGGATGYECIVKLWKSEQATIDAVINFTDSDLLSVGTWSSSSDTKSYPDDMIVIFDREIFNQDIYITHSEIAGSASCNYYFELEVIPLTDQGAEYTTLKDIRTQS